MTYSKFLPGRAIQTGYEWRLRLNIVSTSLAVFPFSAEFSAMLRNTIEGPVIATLTTANSGIVWIDATRIELVLPGLTSKDWLDGEVLIDVVRTDLTPDIHLGFDLVVPVKRSVTRL